jgi:hypothetical protein
VRVATEERKASARRQRVAQVKSVSAPTGGWNKRDELAAMSDKDAVDLVNLFPGTNYVELRGGSSDHATAMGTNGKTLVAHYNPNGTNRMFCFTTAATYNVTSAGGVGASVLSRTEGKHRWVNFGDGTNNWLIAVNGVDKPAYYDGTTWTAVDSGTTPALTGLTTTDIIHVNIFKGRLFYVQKNTLSVWYLAAGVAGGALTEFDLSGVAQKGGYLMAMGTWTVDAGDGPDDRAVFVTSQGEVIVYAGNNPGSSAAWGLIGRFELGKPIGRRCMEKNGGDLLILTENGITPMSAIAFPDDQRRKLAVSYKIENAFTEAARLYASTYGWRMEFYPLRSALVVNIPFAELGTHEQYVMNTTTKAWCRFTGWNAEDFIVFNGDLYFTTSTKVVKAWTGTADGTSAIEGYGKQAFSYFGQPSVQKRFGLFRPVLSVNGTLKFLTDIDVDFNDTVIVGTATYTVENTAIWSSSTWGGGATWGTGMVILKEWTSPDEYFGYCAAGKIKVATAQLTVRWISSDYQYITGSAL